MWFTLQNNKSVIEILMSFTENYPYHIVIMHRSGFPIQLSVKLYKN